MLVLLLVLLLVLVCKVQGIQEEPLEEEPLGSRGKL